jgi:hypothetical protein
MAKNVLGLNDQTGKRQSFPCGLRIETMYLANYLEVKEC